MKISSSRRGTRATVSLTAPSRRSCFVISLRVAIIRGASYTTHRARSPATSRNTYTPISTWRGSPPITSRPAKWTRSRPLHRIPAPSCAKACASSPCIATNTVRCTRWRRCAHTSAASCAGTMPIIRGTAPATARASSRRQAPQRTRQQGPRHPRRKRTNEHTLAASSGRALAPRFHVPVLARSRQPLVQQTIRKGMLCAHAHCHTHGQKLGESLGALPSRGGHGGARHWPQFGRGLRAGGARAHRGHHLPRDGGGAGARAHRARRGRSRIIAGGFFKCLNL